MALIPVIPPTLSSEPLDALNQAIQSANASIRTIENYLKLGEITSAPTSIAGDEGTTSIPFEKRVFANDTGERFYGQLFNSSKLPKWKWFLTVSPDTSSLANNDILVFNSNNNDIMFSSSATLGLVTGATSSSNNAAARWDGTSGLILKNSGVIIDDTNNVTGVTTLTLPNTGLRLKDLDASHDLIISPGANLTANRTLTLTTPDSNITLDFSTVSSGRILIANGTNWLASNVSYPLSCAQGDIIYASSTNTLSMLVKDTTATRYLSNSGSSNNPAWSAVNLSNGVSGTLSVTNGGTGSTTFTANGVLYGNGTNQILATSQGGSNSVLTANAGSPAFSSTPTISTLTLASGQGTASSANFSLKLPTEGAIDVGNNGQQFIGGDSAGQIYIARNVWWDADANTFRRARTDIGPSAFIIGTNQQAYFRYSSAGGFVGDSVTLSTLARFDGAVPGIYVGANIIPTAHLHIASGDTSRASLRLSLGGTPSSPNTGDIWNDQNQNNLSFRLSGITYSFTGTLFTQTSSGVVSNTEVETTLTASGIGTLTLPSNFFVVGKTIRLIASGLFSTNSPAVTLNIRVKLGSTVICSTGDRTPTASLSNRWWRVITDITCRSTGVSGTVMAQSVFEHMTSATGNPTYWEAINTSSVTVNTTSSLAVDLTADWGAGATLSDSITCSNLTLQTIN